MTKICLLCSPSRKQGGICHRHFQAIASAIGDSDHKVIVSCPHCGIKAYPDAYASTCFPHKPSLLDLEEDQFSFIIYQDSGCDQCAENLTEAEPVFAKIRAIPK